MDNIGIPFFNRIAQKIANMRPIPAATKQALVKTMQKGKPLPAPIKKALATRAMVRKSVPAANMVRKSVPAASMVRKSVPAANMVRKSVPAASMVRQSVPAANMVRQAMQQKNGFFNNISKLVQTTNPSVVKAVNPVQRSFMPVDLPYETMSKKKYAMKIPATNFAMPTNIDLVQPPVDGGTSNYYGK
jgi:hypothetical protein